MRQNSLQDAANAVLKENPKLDAFDCAQIAYARVCIQRDKLAKELAELKIKIN